MVAAPQQHHSKQMRLMQPRQGDICMMESMADINAFVTHDKQRATEKGLCIAATETKRAHQVEEQSVIRIAPNRQIKTLSRGHVFVYEKEAAATLAAACVHLYKNEWQARFQVLCA